MAGKDERKTNVPWFSMAEWDQVYKDIYSDDTDSQKRGYERLLVWKARIPVLPASIESTLELIQVCLRDRDIASQICSGKMPAYAEHDLRLMYSTSIMRFLNHLSSITQNYDETLFNLAKKLHIPEWLVCLRHDTAHGFNLPSVGLLRTATHVSLDWLHEHYWKCEAETTSDWVLSEKSCLADPVESSHNLIELIDIWQALKLHALAGYTMVSDILDTELREYVKEIRRKKQPAQSRKGKAVANREVGYSDCEENMKLRFAANMLMQELLNTIRKESNKKKELNMNEELIDIILERESFIPSASSMKLLNKSMQQMLEKDRLSLWLFKLWKDFIISLQKSYSILPQLVCKLVHLTNNETESSHRRKTAALWIKELCRGVEKGRQVLKRVHQWQRKRRNIIREKLLKKQLIKTVAFKVKRKTALEPKMSKKTIWKSMETELEKENPSLKSILCIEIKEISGSMCSPDMLKETILKPNNLTYLFLPSLLDLVIPPVPHKAKEHLLSLVRIYTKSLDESSTKQITERPVHTVEELVFQSKESDVESMDIVCDGLQTSTDGNKQSSLELNPLVSIPAEKSGWIRSEDYRQWSKCPLGILPWQREKVPNFDMPRDITWQPPKLTSTKNTEDETLPGLFHQKINWQEIVRKRPKKSRSVKRNKRSARLVERAFDAVLNLE